MIRARQWQSRTFALGHERSPELAEVDSRLEVWASHPSPLALTALCTAVERWCASKAPAGQKNGHAELLRSGRNKSGAVQELVTDRSS